MKLYIHVFNQLYLNFNVLKQEIAQSTSIIKVYSEFHIIQHKIFTLKYKLFMKLTFDGTYVHMHMLGLQLLIRI